MTRASTVFFVALLAIIATAAAVKANVNSEASVAKAKEPTSAVITGLDKVARSGYENPGYYNGGHGKNPRHPNHPRHRRHRFKSCPCKCFKLEHRAVRQCRKYLGYCGIATCRFHGYPYKGYSCCGSGHYKPGYYDYDYYKEYYGKDYYDYYGKDYYGKDYHGKDYYGEDYYGEDYYGSGYYGGDNKGKDYYSGDHHGGDSY